MKPFDVEPGHTRASAKKRLRGLGARLHQQDAEAQIYYSGPADVWIGAEPDDDSPGKVKLSFFTDCPCTG